MRRHFNETCDKYFLALLLALGIVLMPAFPSAYGETSKPVLENKCLELLRSLLRDSDRITRVHAAESLIQFGEPAGIVEQFREEWNRSRDEIGYRAVVMRVLNRVDSEKQASEPWKRQLCALFCNRENPDRLHAIECLAKLGGSIPASAVEEIRHASTHEKPAIAALSHWALAESGEEGHEDALIAFLASPDFSARYTAAYVLRHRCPLNEANRLALRTAAQAEKPGTLAYSYLNSASFVAAGSKDLAESQRARATLLQVLSSDSKDDIREACAAFWAGGNNSVVTSLEPLLEHAHPDVREGAAHAILEIIQR
jgi:hypothetical protein